MPPSNNLALAARSIPTSPPVPLYFDKRGPCENCLPEVVETWIPSTITTTSCDTTSSTAVWWTPDPTPAPTQPPTAATASTVTVTVTDTVVSYAAAQEVQNASCCQRSGRWPAHQQPWTGTPAKRDTDLFQIPMLDSRARLQRALFQCSQEYSQTLPPPPTFRFARRSVSEPRLLPRWPDDIATQVVTVTAVQTYTSTSTIWSPATPTYPPGDTSSIVPPSFQDQDDCQYDHWCNPRGDGPASRLDMVCGCIVAWLTVIYGGVPSRGIDLAASLIFLFAFMLFFGVEALRLVGCRKQIRVLLVILPMFIFTTAMVGYFGTRAWTSNNESDLIHIQALHAILLCAPLVLLDSAYQLFGLLAKRAAKGCWILYTSWVVRGVNAVMLVICIVAACNFTSFLNAWVKTGENCDTTSSQDLSLLPLVAGFFTVFCILLLMILIVVARFRHCLPVHVLIHVLSILFFIGLHTLWRIMRDWQAEEVWYHGWEKWQPPAQSIGHEPGDGYKFDAVGVCWGVKPNGYPDWQVLSRVRTGAENGSMFYVLGILTLLLALIMLHMANIPNYLAAKPVAEPPRPDPAARYKMTFNSETQRMELSRVDEAEITAAAVAGARGPVDKDGKPYYKLVRSNAGKWKFKGTTAVSVEKTSRSKKMKDLLFGW